MYDAIVVGGRCAGAATARLLALKGYNVLIVDRVSFPSDMPTSTHLIWHAGTAQLEDWGLLDAVRASGCPALETATLDFGMMQLKGTPPSRRSVSAYAPRRIVLDKILLDAAIAAGATVRHGFRVEDVIRENGVVVGVRGTDAVGDHEIRARIVIGADGRSSKIARLVHAVEYNGMPPLEGIRFSYFSGIDLDGMLFVPGPMRMAFAWPTNDDRTLVGIAWSIEDFKNLSDDVGSEFMRELDAWAPTLAAKVRNGNREEAWRGGAVSSVFRKPWGPGWALVGDAGVTLDPITAAGITDALRDAAMLAEAIDRGLSGKMPMDASLEAFEQARNDAITPVYYFAAQMASFAPTPPEIMQMFGALATNQADTDRYFGVFAQTVPVTEFFDPTNITRIIEGG